MNQTPPTQPPKFFPYEAHAYALLSAQERCDTATESTDWRPILLIAPELNITVFALEYRPLDKVYNPRTKVQPDQATMHKIMEPLFAADNPPAPTHLLAALDEHGYECAAKDPEVAASAKSTYVPPSRIILQ